MEDVSGSSRGLVEAERGGRVGPQSFLGVLGGVRWLSFLSPPHVGSPTYQHLTGKGRRQTRQESALETELARGVAFDEF